MGKTYIVLYSTLIIDEVYEEGDTFEFPSGTDRNFIERLETIGAIKELKEEDDSVFESDPDGNLGNDAGNDGQKEGKPSKGGKGKNKDKDKDAQK